MSSAPDPVLERSGSDAKTDDDLTNDEFIRVAPGAKSREGAHNVTVVEEEGQVVESPTSPG